MSAGIGAFLEGVVEGRERRRRWDQENEDREWTRNRRGRDLVLDGQQDEDRGRRIGWEDETRARDRTVWGQSDHDRGRRIEQEDYYRGRSRAGDAREDADRNAAIAAGTATADALAAELAARNSVAPVIPEYAPSQMQVPGQIQGRQLPQPVASVPLGASGSEYYPPAAPVGALPSDQLSPQFASAGRHISGPAVGQPGGGESPVVDQSQAPAPVSGAMQGRTLSMGVADGAGVGSLTRALHSGGGTAQPGIQEAGASIRPPDARPGAQGAMPATGTPQSEPGVETAAPATTAALAASAPPAATPATRPEPPEKIARRASAMSRDFMRKYTEVGAPMQIDHYLRTGQIEKAEAFRDFIESSEAKEGMRHFGRAIAYAQGKDPIRAFDSLINAFNSKGYSGSGMTALRDESWIEVNPETGQISGNILLEDENGDTHEVPFDGMDDLYHIGLGEVAPETVFERYFERMKGPEYRVISGPEAAAMGLDPAKAYNLGQDGKISQIGGAGTNVNVSVGGDGAPGLGKLSTDFGYVLDPETREPVIDPNTGLPVAAPVPGSPAARKIEEEAAQAGMRSEQAAMSADIVLDNLARARQQIEDGGILPVTGFGAERAASIGGTAAHDLQQTLLTVQANVGFDRLQQMREASPTGGALGAISDRELATLQAVMGSLAQSQSKKQLLENLDRLEETYAGIMRKAAAYPNAHEFGFDSAVLEYGLSEQGRDLSDDDLMSLY